MKAARGLSATGCVFFPRSETRANRLARAAASGMKLAHHFCMNQIVTSFVGWLAWLLLLTTATVLWGIAALLVWMSGNSTARGGTRRFAR